MNDKYITIRLKEDLYTLLKEYAIQHEMTMCAVVRLLLRKELKQDG